MSVSVGIHSEAVRPLEALLLVCALSHKRLVDPVMLEPFGVVEHSSGKLYSAGGLLYRTINGVRKQQAIASLAGESGVELRQVLAQTREYNGTEVYLLCLYRIGHLARPIHFGSAGLDFLDVIRQANETDLVSRGPLELKNTSVIPPQIVLDNEV